MFHGGGKAAQTIGDANREEGTLKFTQRGFIFSGSALKRGSDHVLSERHTSGRNLLCSSVQV